MHRDVATEISKRLCGGRLVEQMDPVSSDVREAIMRNAFLYLEPQEEKNADQFAQCATCMMFTGDSNETCTIHGPDERIVAGGSCGFYVEGDPMPDEAGHEMTSVTKEGSGYVERPARIRVKAYDEKGEQVELELEGFPAVVMQHECDHLDGILYVDRITDRTKLGFESEVQRFHDHPEVEDVDDDDDE